MAADASTVHAQIAEGLRAHPAKKGMLFNIAVTAVEVGGSIALFHLARQHGATDVVSYLVGSIAPVVGGLLVWGRARKFSGASAAIFAFTALSALIALLGSTTPRVLLYKDCATIALIGLLFAGSALLTGKPVVFYMAQRYGTDGTHDGMAVFEAMWTSYPHFRRGIYVVSYLWASLFVVDAGAAALIIRQSSYSTGYDYDQILPLVAIAVGIIGSIVISRYYTNKATDHALHRHEGQPDHDQVRDHA